MKKIIFLTIAIILIASRGHAQCVTGSYASFTGSSNNLGLSQELTTCTYNGAYVEVDNILVGEDYIFTLNASGAKYVTLTDDSNTVIAHGLSPLTVNNLAVGTVRLHTAENASCDPDYDCTTATIQIILTCPPVTTFSVSGITTSNATFNWTAGGAESDWEVLVLNNGDPAPTSGTSGIAVTNPTYTTTSLSPANLYQFYIRPICSVSDKGPWNGPLSFASGCNPVSTLNESFGSVGFGEAPPVCWSAIISPSLASLTNNIAGTSSNKISVYSYGDASTGNLVLASPVLSNVGAGTHRIKFKASSPNGATLEVGTLNNNTSTATFSAIQTITLTNVETEYKINLAGYSGSDDFIGFRNSSSGAFVEIIIDDIVWEVAPSCPDVATVKVPLVNPTTATVTWVAGGPQTSWQVVVGSATATNPNALTPINASGSPTRTVTGLVANTTYRVWVRTQCAGPTYGAWEGPITFKTACTDSSVFTNNFDAIANGSLPGCWSKVITGSSASNGATVGVNQPFSGGSKNVLLFNQSGLSTDNVILVSPRLNNVGAGTYRLVFKAKESNGSDLEIGTLNTETNDAVFTTLETIAVTNTLTEYKIDFSGYSGANKYIGIRIANPNNYVNFEVDDLVWELNPTCLDVSNHNLTALTSNSATVAWTAGVGQTQWNAVIGSSTATNPNLLTPVTISSAQATFSGLAPSTTYKVWSRGDCGPSDKGYWIGPFTFKTPCAASTSFNESFTSMSQYAAPTGCWTSIKTGAGLSSFASIQVTWDGVGFTNGIDINTNGTTPGSGDKLILVSPQADLTATQLKFFAKAGFGSASLEVGTLNSSLSNATFTPLPVTINLTNDYAEYTVDLSTYTGTDKYIGFSNRGDVSVVLDDIRLISLGTRIRPNQCGRTLRWLDEAIQASPVAGATQYRFEVIRTDNPLDTRTITVSKYFFNPATQLSGGLIYGKSYNIRVKVFIGATEYPWGSTCVVTAPNEPVVSTTQVRPFQCGATLPSITTSIEASPIYSATQYEFEVTYGTTTVVVPSTQYHFKLTSLPAGGATLSTPYSIRVRAFVGSWLAWGSTCIVTTPGPIARMSSNSLNDVFEVKAFPNPFATNFALNIESSSDDVVEMKVYDMIGRQLDAIKATASELSNQEIGSSYPSGVYNLVVSQGQNVKSIRMIKR